MTDNHRETCRPLLQIQPTHVSRDEWSRLAESEGLGYEVLELSAPPALNESGLFEQAREWYRAGGRAHSLHGNFIDVNPASGDIKYRELSKERCIESCEAAVFIGAENVVFHSTSIIVVFSDLSELMDLRDAVQSMEKIQSLNNQLEIRNKLISETFGRFLSDDIVKHLLDTPEGLQLGGRKQTLTIMMSDLRGFTALSERMDAADLVSMLNHYLGEMTDAIQAHKGTIIEFIGDGIMALFGAPEASDTHATDAVAAALEMQSKMEKVNEWNISHDYPILEMGIGLNTGEVIVGNIGSEKRTKYGVVGSHVNLCGRIESYTVGGQILISPSTRELISSELEIEKEMTVYPKGANGELMLSQITGIGAPYNIHVEVNQNIPVHLERPIPVCMYRIDGKHGTAKALYGGLTAVSNSGALLETDVKFEIYDNIQINAGGKLFCKIMERKDNYYVLQYTSVPTGYAAWLKESK